MNHTEKLRIGIFGGTFDPIHNGHLRLAYAFQKELMLSKVYFVPAGWPYHKTNQLKTSPLQRLTMVKLAIEDEPLFAVDESEIHQSTPAYTVETLIRIRKGLGQNVALWYLMGMDTFSQLTLWKNWQKFLLLTNIAVAERNPKPILCPPLNRFWKGKSKKPPLSIPSGKIYALKFLPAPISSSYLREKLTNINSNELDIPQKVLQYVVQEKLYLASNQKMLKFK